MKPVDNRWREEGTYVIWTRPRSLGESTHIIAYSKDYGKAWRYWMFNPEGLPDNDGWLMSVVDRGMFRIIKKPMPPDRLKKLRAAKANRHAS